MSSKLRNSSSHTTNFHQKTNANQNLLNTDQIDVKLPEDGEEKMIKSQKNLKNLVQKKLFSFIF